MLTVCTAGSKLDRVILMVGATKESLSVLDRDLIVERFLDSVLLKKSVNNQRTVD